MSVPSLPIWEIHSAILEQLKAGNRLVLVAPTGSGKTTQVPQMLLDAGLAGEKKIVVLQPRRVAARTVAARVAWERKCRLGEEVGYQIRFDDRLQDDPALSDVGILLFDEFHERNLLSDVALALAKQMQQTTRPDLKLAVMSATLDAEPVAKYLDDAPILISEGINFPVEVNYLDYADARPFTEQAADAVERIVNSGERGDVLVFMPGMGEINATMNAIRAARMNERVALIPLHGDLPPEQQDEAFAPNPLRKIVVATNVAETSVTIDGIRHVVDAGQARVARYDAERGIGTLFLEEISRASADQRKGRAGRTASGTCWRLWTDSGHLNRPERNTPEIQRSDLAETVLLLHSLGIKRAVTFDWLDKPDVAAVERAEKLLHTLGALSNDEARMTNVEGAPVHHSSFVIRHSSDLTPIGRQMLRLPMHPRYSRMLVEAAKLGCVRAAALCAALVSGRDLLMRVPRGDDRMSEARELFEASALSDFFTLMRAYEFAKRANFNVEQCRRYGIHAQTAKQVQQTFEQIVNVAEQQKLGENAERGARNAEPKEAAAPPSDDALLKCLLAGFADQLAIRRDQGTLECELTEKRQGTLVRESVVTAPLFVAASIREVEGALRPLTLLGMATAVKREWIEEMFPDQLNATVEHLFDRGQKRVAAVKLVRFQDLVIHHEHQKELDPDASGRCLADAYAKGWFDLHNLSHDLKQFIARVNLVAVAMPDLEYPPLDEAALAACFTRAFRGLWLVKEAQAADLKPAFHAHLQPAQVGWLDELTPLSIPWPGGKAVKLLYSEETDLARGEAAAPEAQVKITDCFQVKEHPLICEGTLPVKVWLCTPDGKRLDSTCDWPDWRARTYPKHKSALQKKFPGSTWL
ncbi:MAG: ATP-dependent RNA helicase [Verrucomicrobia bacterium]|nr:ATP-dependent RNA helicase [Verrucomicrobiota bacterium]